MTCYNIWFFPDFPAKLCDVWIPEPNTWWFSWSCFSDGSRMSHAALFWIHTVGKSSMILELIWVSYGNPAIAVEMDVLFGRIYLYVPRQMDSTVVLGSAVTATQWTWLCWDYQQQLPRSKWPKETLMSPLGWGLPQMMTARFTIHY